MTDVANTAAAAVPAKVQGPLLSDADIAAGKPSVQFRVGGGDTGTARTQVSLALPAAPSFADLVARDGQESVLKLIQPLLDDCFSEAVRDMYKASKKFDEASQTHIFASLPESFDPVAVMLQALQPAERAKRSTAARDNFAFADAAWQAVKDAYIGAFTQRFVATQRKAPDAKALKELATILETIFTGKVTAKTLVSFQKFGTKPLFVFLLSQTPSEHMVRAASRVEYVQQALEESANATSRAGLDWTQA